MHFSRSFWRVLFRGASALAICGACVVTGTLEPSAAEARKQRELPYRFEQVWNAALRLVRVDLRLPVTERDQEGGFVLFEYLSNEKSHPGSIELVSQARGARPTTVAVVQVQGMPSYVEQMILDRLDKKLQAEVGAPPPAPKPVPEPPVNPGPQHPTRGSVWKSAA